MAFPASIRVKAAFENRVAFGIHLTGLVDFRIDTRKASKSASTRIVPDIANLSHRLSGSNIADTEHGMDSLILRSFLTLRTVPPLQ